MNFYLKACRFTKWWLFITTRFPIFERELVEQNLDHKALSFNNQLEEFTHNSAINGRLRAALMILLYSLYSVKNSIIILKTFDYYDHSNPENSIELVSSKNGQVTIQFACFTTNCTRLSRHSTLAHDLSELHVFGLCNPNLDILLTPVSKLNAFGMFVTSLSTFGVILLGAWPLAQQFLFEASNETIMSIVAPDVTKGLMRSRARTILTDLFISFHHFAFETRRNWSTVANNDSGGRWHDNVRTVLEQGRHRATPRHELANWVVDLRARKPSRSRAKTLELVERMTDGCLPIVRSDWWQVRIAQMFCYTLLITISGVLLLGGIILNYIILKIRTKTDAYREFSNEMSQHGCSIWRTQAGPSSSIQLERVSFHWQPFQVVEICLIVLVPVVNGLVLLSYYYMAVCEALCWLTELKEYLIGSLAFVEFHSISQNKDTNLFKLSELRRKFIESTEFKFILFYHESDHNPLIKLIHSKFQHKNGSSQRGELLPKLSISSGSNCSKADENDNYGKWKQFYNHPNELEESYCESNVENLEKVYVNFRLFVGHVRDCTPGIAVLIAITYLLNYGSLLICIVFSRRVKNFTIEPIIVIIFAFLFSNFLILLGSNFHANVSRRQLTVCRLLCSNLLTIYLGKENPANYLVLNCSDDTLNRLEDATLASLVVAPNRVPQPGRRNSLEGVRCSRHICPQYPGKCLV